MEISVKAAYSPSREPSLLSNTSSIDACPTGLRPLEPLKMTSVMFSPRRFLAEDSPITQRTASMMLDFPQPLGPTTAHRLLGKLTVVGSTKDLKPASLMHFSRIFPGRSCIHSWSYGTNCRLQKSVKARTNVAPRVKPGARRVCKKASRRLICLYFLSNFFDFAKNGVKGRILHTCGMLYTPLQ